MNDSEMKGETPQADEFEQLVRRALGRVDVPEGFAARVLERAVASEVPLPWRPRFMRATLRAWVGAIAAIVVLAALVANQIRVRRERVAEIQAQFNTAMRATDNALEQTRAELERVGLKLGE